MRVTKTIKDYITKEVNKAYAPKVEEIGADYNALIDRVENQIEEIIKRANEEVNNLLRENNLAPNYDKENLISSWGGFSNKEISDEITRTKRKLREEISDKITEIIIMLELGGSKADLDRMLENI